MALTKLTDNLNSIQSLPNKPSLEAEELKAEFDKSGNLIKAYIVKNGVIDKRILNEDPFTSYGSILQIFDGQINLVQIIIMIINLINGNGCYIQQDA